jgi:uncharacterized protein (TIGR02453 family)
MSFNGFTKEALSFLFENRMRNSKEWYDEHKDVYKRTVYEPFVALVQEIAPEVLKIDEKLITTPSRIISRVRRDTRFTKDKSLYRDNAWIVFLRDKSQMSTAPCFWFEVSQNGSSYGVGYYGAQASAMARMRELILERHPVFLAALKCYESQDQFVMGGESYKRNRYPDEPENLQQWLNRKNIYFECVQKDFSLAFSKALPDALKEGYMKLKPIYDFLCLVEGIL